MGAGHEADLEITRASAASSCSVRVMALTVLAIWPTRSHLP